MNDAFLLFYIWPSAYNLKIVQLDLCDIGAYQIGFKASLSGFE